MPNIRSAAAPALATSIAAATSPSEISLMRHPQLLQIARLRLPHVCFFENRRTRPGDRQCNCSSVQANLHSWMMSACRGRSNITTVTSPTALPEHDKFHFPIKQGSEKCPRHAAAGHLKYSTICTGHMKNHLGPQRLHGYCLPCSDSVKLPEGSLQPNLKTFRLATDKLQKCTHSQSDSRVAMSCFQMCWFLPNGLFWLTCRAHLRHQQHCSFTSAASLSRKSLPQGLETRIRQSS